MRAVRFTKLECEAVLAALADWTSNQDKAWQRAIDSARTKLEAAQAPEPSGVSVGPIEAALIRMARGKVVQLESGPAGYGRASKMATACGATVEEAELVGAWLSRQRWMNEPTTILGVLNKWAEWLPRARATVPPPATAEGFDGTGTAGPGAGGPGRRGGGRGSAPGFG
jgi:hypothetical protein